MSHNVCAFFMIQVGEHDFFEHLINIDLNRYILDYTKTKKPL